MGKQAKVLRQVRQVALFRGTVDGQGRVEKNLVRKHDAAALRLQQSQDRQQQAGLARAVGTNQGQRLGTNLQ